MRCHHSRRILCVQAHHHGRADSSAGGRETAQIERIIRGLKGRGIPLVLVSHNLRQVLDLVDHVWVFRRGRIVDMLKASETTGNDIVAMITGVNGESADNARSLAAEDAN